MQEAQSRIGAAEAVGPALARPKGHGVVSGIWKFCARYPLGAFGALVLIILVAVAIAANLVARYDPLIQDIPNRLHAPSGQFWLGTDTFGRDAYSRIIHGSRISIYVGLVSVTLGTVAGTLLGISSGYLGGKYDLGVQRVVDALMGIPSLLLAMVMVVALGASLNNVALAIGIGLTPRMTRLARSAALSVKEEVYVMAAEAIGVSKLRTMLLHVLPNCLAPVFVLATGYLGTAVVAEASLSFLGLGVPPPHPSWGGMLEIGARGHLETAPWLAVFPGVALSLVVFAFAFFGDALRDAFDPRLRGR